MQLVAEPGPQDVVEADQATKVTSVSSLSSLSLCLSLPTSTATQGPVESCWTTSASRARAALCANSFQRLASLLAGPWSRLLRLIGHRVSSATLPVSKVTNSSKPSGTRLADAFPIFCVSRSMSTCFARTNPSLPFQSHEQLYLQFCGANATVVPALFSKGAPRLRNRRLPWTSSATAAKLHDSLAPRIRNIRLLARVSQAAHCLTPAKQTAMARGIRKYRSAARPESHD